MAAQKKSATPPIPEDVKAMSFETAVKELEGIVDKLERGNVELEESIAQYERGVALKAHCEAKLADAKARIEKIVASPGGPGGSNVAAEPVDLE